MRYKREGFKALDRNALLGIVFVAALALLVALPAWAAPPAGYTAEDIGDVGARGSVNVDASGLWTVQGSGDMGDTTTADWFFFVSQKFQGDGTIMARLVAQLGGGQAKTGIMIRDTNTEGSPYAGLIMTTSTLAWQYRTVPDGATVRPRGPPYGGPGNKIRARDTESCGRPPGRVGVGSGHGAASIPTTPAASHRFHPRHRRQSVPDADD